MDFRFNSNKLKKLYETEVGAGKYPEAVIDAFFDLVEIIESALNEKDFYSLKSLHYEKLKGKRGKLGERSMRLNDQYRLIVSVEKTDKGKTIVVHEITDYHKG